MDEAPTPQRLEFAARLNEICGDMGLPSERGRQAELGRLFKVSGKAARKWLLGMNYPEMETAVRIADWAGVNLTWLLQGTGPKRGSHIDTRALVLDEAVRSLPADIGADLLDTLRAKPVRFGKLQANEAGNRYGKMLDYYQEELAKRRH